MGANVWALRMRCCFVKDARIVAVEELIPGLSVDEAIESARIIFDNRASPYDGIEVWSLTRMLYKQDGVSHPLRGSEQGEKAAVRACA